MAEQHADDWRTRAACADHPRVDFTRPNPAARTICHGCPVAQDCLHAALQEPQQPYLGLRGGRTHPEALNALQALLSAPPRRTRRPQAVCGTDAGYRRHIVNHETTCDPCRAAHAKVVRKWEQARRRARREADAARAARELSTDPPDGGQTPRATLTSTTPASHPETPA